MASRQLLTVEQAADYLNRTSNWLAKQRCFGGGPLFVKLGRRVFYDVRDLDAFIEQNKRRSTSEGDHHRRAT